MRSSRRPLPTTAAVAGAVLLVGSVAFVAPLAPALAGGTRSFRQTAAKDFEEGEATASMILPGGEIVAGMRSSRVGVDASFVWSSAVSPDGRTVYFGGGDQGRIFSVPAAAPGGGKEPDAKKLAEVDAAWVTSLAVRPDGTLLAGSTPGGRVFSVDPATGASKVFAKVPGEHVWALLHDARTGLTWAAAGGEGKVFAIDAKGNAKLYWDADDKHVVSLFAPGDGTLLAGTSSKAVLYRIRGEGRAEALHDFEADEVRAMARSGKSVFIAVNAFDSGGSGGGGTAPGPTAAKGTSIKLGPAPASVGAPSRSGQVKALSAVYRLDEDGSVEQVFALADGYLTSLLADANGTVLAASGTQGRIYRLFPDRTFALVADLAERQALTLARAGGDANSFLVGTGDIGGVYRVRPAGASEAQYLSKVFDAETFARWGLLRWRGTPDVVFETRSGNTAKPDKSWTAWTRLQGSAAAHGEGEGKIASPAGRYLQYRVHLPAKAAFKEATLHYLPQNLRPRITDVTQAPPAGGDGPAARTHSPVLKLRFKVDNPDGDDLIYRVAVKADGDRVWRPLGGPDPLTKPEFDWNTESVPDGKYVVRVWVSDERSTSGDRALDSTFVSTPFLVDNTRPEVQNLTAKGTVISGRVVDAASPISAIEYSVDGGEWRPVDPSDGILDQKVESFSFKLPADVGKGLHVVTVRAYDSADNVGSARVQVEVPTHPPMQAEAN